MTTWSDLDAELNNWVADGRRALFWWRDDDAVDVTPALENLLTLASDAAIPLTLAVIPATASQALAARLKAVDHVAVVQHGWAHANHANAMAKKSEFPASRLTADMLSDLRQGRERLLSHFGSSILPVFVPPWNRMAESLLPQLPRLGFHGISRFKARDDLWAAPGLMQVNTHLDPIDWRQGSFAGTTECLTALVTELRRSRSESEPEPCGLLTHHLRHDAAGWDFVGTLIRHVAAHQGAQWIDLTAAFGAGPSPLAAKPS